MFIEVTDTSNTRIHVNVSLIRRIVPSGKVDGQDVTKLIYEPQDIVDVFGDADAIANQAKHALIRLTLQD